MSPGLFETPRAGDFIKGGSLILPQPAIAERRSRGPGHSLHLIFVAQLGYDTKRPHDEQVARNPGHAESRGGRDIHRVLPVGCVGGGQSKYTEGKSGEANGWRCAVSDELLALECRYAIRCLDDAKRGIEVLCFNGRLKRCASDTFFDGSRCRVDVLLDMRDLVVLDDGLGLRSVELQDGGE